MTFKKNIREAIARTDMPQISAKKHDEVVERMIEAGVDVVDTPIDIDLLKPVQDGINRKKVENIKQAIKDGEEMHPIVVSREGYVIDGHHRMVAMQELGEKQINCSVVKLPKTETLHVVEYFAESQQPLNERGGKIPLHFWIVYHNGESTEPGQMSRRIAKPFVISVHPEESTAKREAAKSPYLGHAKVETFVPHYPD